MLKHIIAAAALASLASASFAAEQSTVPYKPTEEKALTGFYAGVDMGGTKAYNNSDFELSYGLLAGYKFNQNFAVEAGVRRLVDDPKNIYDTDFKQYSLSGLGILPLQNGFSVYGRLGMNRLSQNAGWAPYRYRENKLLWGLGASYELGKNFTGRIEAQKPSGNITNVSASLLYSF